MSKQKIQKSMYGVLKDSSFSRNEKGNLVVKGYFTSDNKDMVGDVITKDATERAIPLYRQWGNVRYLHTPKPVGKVRSIGVEDGLEWNECEIEVIDPDAIFQVENELLTALSVGILIDFNDIDFDEDTGGFIINDYTLAEISLVDHPANYDAKLKDIVLDSDARQIALQYGLDGLANHIGGDQMKKKIKGAEEFLEVSEEAEEVTPEEVVTEEAPVEEEAPIEEPVVEVEPVVEEEAIEEEELEEEIEEIPQEEIEEDKVENEKPQEKDIPVQNEDLRVLFQEINSSIKTLVDLQKSGKGSEEEQETDTVKELQKKLDAITEMNEHLNNRIKELETTLPAGRKGAVAETNLSDLEEDVTVEEKKIPSLKDALRQRYIVE